MGLINKDNFETYYGYSVQDTYISLGNNEVSLRREEGNWILEAHFNLWHSKDLRIQNKRAYKGFHVRKLLTDSELSSNIFDLAYTEVKKQFTNTTDDL